MQIIEPFVEIREFDPVTMLRAIERAGRTCYKSEDHITSMSAVKFVQSIVKNGHHSVLEHEFIQTKFIVDRGVSHELVRHRLNAISQESTRYCNYGSEKHGGEITVIRPFFFEIDSPQYYTWKQVIFVSEQNYLALLQMGYSPQEARSVLPNSLKTEVVFTANLRQWMHIFQQRCAKAAHPQMKQVMIPLRNTLAIHLPMLFADINYDTEFKVENYAGVTWIE